MKTVPSANFTAEAPPESEKDALVAYDFNSKQPASVYYNGEKMPWAKFNQRLDKKQLLSWVETASKAWYVNATAPKGTWVREIIYVPASGNLTLNRHSGDGSAIMDYGYTMPGYGYIWFDVDKKGTHLSVFAIGGLQSNNVTISAP